jgi:hypothetical protein
MLGFQDDNLMGVSEERVDVVKIPGFAEFIYLVENAEIGEMTVFQEGSEVS